MASGNTMNQVKAKVSPNEGSQDIISNAFNILVDFARESGYVSEMYKLKSEFESNFTPKKSMYERIGTSLKNAIVTCNVPAELGKNVYYSVRTVDMERGENIIKETYVTNGVVPYSVFEISLKTLEELIPTEVDENKKIVSDYVKQLCSMRLFDKIRERYIKDKDMVFSIMVNPIMMSKLEVMLMQERNLDDVAGCRIQFHPGNKNYYKEGSDDFWKRQWLSSVESFVVESYIKPHKYEDDVFHQVTVSGFQSVASADKAQPATKSETKKRKNSNESEDSETKKPKTNSNVDNKKEKKEKSKKA